MPHRFYAVMAMILIMSVFVISTVHAQEDTATTDQVIVTPSEESQNILFIMGQYVENLHAVTMGLKLANMVADQADVSVFLNLEAARLADKRLPRDFNWLGSPTVDNLMDELLQKGAKIVVCPHCAHSAGVSEDVLVEGVNIATPEEVRHMILMADKVINY